MPSLLGTYIGIIHNQTTLGIRFLDGYIINKRGKGGGKKRRKKGDGGKNGKLGEKVVGRGGRMGRTEEKKLGIAD